MSGGDVKKDARDDDRLLLQKLFEERQAVVERGRQVLKVEPDVESRDGRDLDLESELLESLEHVIALVLEVLLKGDLLLHDTIGVEKRNGGKLESINGFVNSSLEKRVSG